jgi:formylglycine-generating enzyme required for sulfatase activity
LRGNIKSLLIVILFGLMVVGCVEEAKKEAVQEDKTKNETTINLRENFTVPDLNLDMIWCPPGTFTMGSPTTEAGRQADLEDEHNVSLTRGFYLGKYEVTQAQYEAVMTGVTGDGNATPSRFHGYPNRPVENVSWNDAQVFLTGLNEQQEGDLPAGWSYVLPTEAQWEYACRAGTTSAYSWGNDINSSRANYNWDGDQDNGQTQDVGMYAPNSWGFFDMHGNVWEWTADLYAVYSSEAQTDPTGPASGSGRVLRGGGWDSTDRNLRSAKTERFRGHPGYRGRALGFRIGFQKNK